MLYRLIIVLSLVALFLMSACGDPDQIETQRGTNSESSSGSYFVDASKEIGLDFIHQLELTGQYRIFEINGSGMAVFDANGDKRLDLVCLNAGSRKNEAVDKLYFQGPDGTLVESSASGFSPHFSTGCAVADLDNDGDVDMYVGAVGMDHIYLNDGKGNFEDVSQPMGLKDNGFTSSIAFLDYDNDGFLDVFVCRYTTLVEPPLVCLVNAGKQDFCHPRVYKKISNQLLRNVDGKKFVDVSESKKIDRLDSYALGVVVEDFNYDGWPDLYVANDGFSNFLLLNDQKGGFEESAMLYGAAVNSNGEAEASMGLAVGDVDNDQLIDIFITNLMTESNTLYLGQKDQTFTDGTARNGLSVASLPYTGWGTSLFDMENDGDLDLMVVNGSVAANYPPKPGAKKGSLWEQYAEANLCFENTGNGRFKVAEEQAKEPCSWVANHRTLVHVDFDGDGKEDIFINAISEETKYFRNVASNSGNFLKVEVINTKLNRYAIGAVVQIYCGDKSQRRIVSTSSSFHTSTLAPLHFGLGSAEEVDKIKVTFPGGEIREYPAAKAGQTVTLTR